MHSPYPNPERYPRSDPCRKSGYNPFPLALSPTVCGYVCLRYYRGDTVASRHSPKTLPVTAVTTWVLGAAGVVQQLGEGILVDLSLTGRGRSTSCPVDYSSPSWPWNWR